MKLDIQLNRPMHDILPKEWSEKFEGRKRTLDYCPFRNLQHFKNYVSTITQKNDDKCGVSYKEALDDLIKEKSQYDAQEYETIRDLVRQNLHKRGLITDEIYDRYKYNVEGVIVDIAELATGNPECALTPAYNYKNHFYELYISISYPYHVENKTVRQNAIRLLSTIEELERQHIYIKVTLVFADVNVTRDGDRDLLMTIPLFSYKDFKSIETMSAVVNERLLRKFGFALLEDVYGKNLDMNYGQATDMYSAINIGDLFDEIVFFNKVLEAIGEH